MTELNNQLSFTASNTSSGTSSAALSPLLPLQEYANTALDSHTDSYAENHTLAQPPHAFEFVLLTQAKEIAEAQRFRARVFAEMFPVQFDGQQDMDVYDAYSIHAAVRCRHTHKIAAYTRVITPRAKQVLGQYYSEREYDLTAFLQGKKKVYELGRTCVDSHYRGTNVLAVLWTGLLPLVCDTLGAEHIIGCVSLSLNVNPVKVSATAAFIQKTTQKRKVDVRCLYPVRTQDWIADDLLNDIFSANTLSAAFKRFKSNKKQVAPLFKHYKKMKAKFAPQPYYDPMFHCLDYFAAIKISKLTRFKIQMVCKLMELKAS